LAKCEAHHCESTLEVHTWIGDNNGTHQCTVTLQDDTTFHYIKIENWRPKNLTVNVKGSTASNGQNLHFKHRQTLQVGPEWQTQGLNIPKKTKRRLPYSNAEATIFGRWSIHTPGEESVFTTFTYTFENESGYQPRQLTCNVDF
jgi:hypothetical protein